MVLLIRHVSFRKSLIFYGLYLSLQGRDVITQPYSQLRSRSKRARSHMVQSRGLQRNDGNSVLSVSHKVEIEED